MRKQQLGLTLIEALTVIAITGVLMGILIPVIGMARRSARINGAASNLRQLSVNLNLYRSDWNGSDTSFESYYALGLPPSSYVQNTMVTQNSAIMRSPCGVNLSAFNTAMFPGAAGNASAVFAASDPIYSPKQAKEFKDQLSTYKQNSVMFLDVNCNDSDVKFNEPYGMKRGLAVLFSGELVNKFDKGFASALKWYTKSPSSE